MKLSITLELDIRDDDIRETTVQIDHLECSLCYRHIPKGKLVVSAHPTLGARQLWLCPEHIIKGG